MMDLRDRTWERLRCRECRRLLLKATPFCLREGAALEVKCSHCNTMNYLLGRPDVLVPSSEGVGVTT